MSDEIRCPECGTWCQVNRCYNCGWSRGPDWDHVEKCPGCGAKGEAYINKMGRVGSWGYDCESVNYPSGQFIQSQLCFKRQIAVKDEELADRDERIKILEERNDVLARAGNAVQREREEAKTENTRLREACIKDEHEIQQVLGKALGYPELYPKASEVDDGTVCVGEHVGVTVAQEAADKIKSLEQDAEDALDGLLAIPNALRIRASKYELEADAEPDKAERGILRRIGGALRNLADDVQNAQRAKEEGE